MPDPDAIVIGSGHNGLICANYLARAGMRVLVVERRHIAGGCTATEELAPGVLISRCFCDHVLLYTTPIPTELELGKHGLENLSVDPYRVAPRLNDEGLVFWSDVEQTAECLGRRSPRDARAYRRFVHEWSALFDWLQPILLGPPNERRMRGQLLRDPKRLLGGIRQAPLLRRAMRASVRDVLDGVFEDMHLKGVLAFVSAGLTGVSPRAVGSALGLFNAVLPHRVGVRRPRGGSGGLVRALIRSLEEWGGTVRTRAEVDRIVVADGVVRGVRLAEGIEIEAPVVVASCDPQTTFLRLLSHQDVPSNIRGAIERLQIANGFALKVDYLVDRLPEWRTHTSITPAEQARATKVVCPSMEYLEAAYFDYEKQRNPRWPALMVGTPTVQDPALSREALHLLTLETRYTPYVLEGGLSWHTIRQQEGERLLHFLAQYAPNLPDAERLRIVQTPEDLERDLGLPRAHMLHLDAVPGQLLGQRPLAGLANYDTPLEGLYLTGAGTHPGGGVWGAPGRNAAHVILDRIR